MAVIEFVGQSSKDSTAQPANTSRLINLYREPVKDGGNTRYLLRPAPGRELVADIGSAFLRSMAWANGSVYAVANSALFSVTEAGTTASLGAIDDDVNTSMAANETFLTICANGKYYVYDDGSLTQPTGAAFSDFGSVCTVGQYTVLTEKDGLRIQWTDLGDPLTFDALNFASTDGADNNIIRALDIGPYLWVFKERTVEIWYNTTLANDEAFARVQGGLSKTGLKSFNLVCAARDSAFFIGSDNVPYLTTGSTPQPLFNPAVQTAIKNNNPTHCVYYEQFGEKFCEIRFSDRPAWVLGVATIEWHERARGPEFDPSDHVSSVESDAGEFWTGAEGGKIARMTQATTDLGETMYRRAVSKTLRVDSQRFSVPEFEIFGAYGYADAQDAEVGLLDLGGNDVLAFGDDVYPIYDNPGNEPHLMLSFSGDYGATFRSERFLPMGAIGEYTKRTVARRCGHYRQFVAQVDLTHAFYIPIYADARVEVA